MLGFSVKNVQLEQSLLKKHTSTTHKFKDRWVLVDVLCVKKGLNVQRIPFNELF